MCTIQFRGIKKISSAYADGILFMSFLTPKNHTDGAYTAVRIRADTAICKISALVNVCRKIAHADGRINAGTSFKSSVQKRFILSPTRV